MADFNNTSHKGAVLMQQALKKYAEGDFEAGDKDREEANRYFDIASLQMNSEEGKITRLYGESRNFGIIYNVFEQNIDKLMESDNGKKILKEGYNLIKGNKVLNEQFKVYDLFESADNVNNPKDFVNEATSLIKNIDKKQVKENNEKFIKFIRDNNLDEYVNIPEDTENLYEAIEYLVLNKKTINNVQDFLDAQNIIAEGIQKKNAKKEDDDPEPKKTDSLYTKDYNLWRQKWMAWHASHDSKDKKPFDKFKEKIKEEEEKVEESINDDERKLLDEFTDSKANIRHLFETYKSNTLKAINEMIEISNGSDKEQWGDIYNKVSSRNYSDNLTENITNCAEMLEICSTIKE